MPVYRIDLAYEGTGFRGLARQQGQRTVQGLVEEALARIIGHEVTTAAAGRTDAGVHARQQVMSFEHDHSLDVERVQRALAGLIGPEVVPYFMTRAAEGFHARHSALTRSYRYRILNGRWPDPLRRNLVWHVPEPLEQAAMSETVGHLIGEHDFASFCRARPPAHTVRRVMEASWARSDDILELAVQANAFCHQMVRSIVGFSVDVGRGRRHAAEITHVLAARDRAMAGQMAPAHGLILWEVEYELAPVARCR
ncbi:MAG: tRNA pseudouridine(38-40) synthase TruA [Actinomycetota bacterium]